jgi:16S rRNA (adenine1518-N6/adenine1519-N6)-dimethyltransferase
MDLTKPSDLKRLLQAHGLHLSKRFGQNFLVDRTHLMRVVDTAGVGPEDAVFEVGPGVGTLTVELAQRARRVLSVELDRGIVPVLTDTVAPYPNVSILQGDALKLDLQAVLPEHLGAPPYKVAANIPYNITSPLLVRFLEAKGLFSSVTLMVQKEVADRLRAKPGTDAYGSLTVFAQYYAEVEMVGVVPRGAFFPPPKVDSAVVRLVPRPVPPVDAPSEAAFFAVSRAVFNQRRKTIHNALSNAPAVGATREQVAGALTSAGIAAERRGETLDLEEIAAIARALPFDNSDAGAV